MKKIILFVVVATLCLNFSTNAQIITKKKFLQVGDVMPDYPIRNLMNSKIKNTKISDYKGKLVILDFWSTWCSACIKGFPELDSLQHQYSGKIQVFLVNLKSASDSERGVRIVLNRMNTWSERPFILPIAFSDSIISSNFEIHSIPHVIWIGPDGKIIGITDKPEVTSKNISKVLSGQPINLIQKTN